MANEHYLVDQLEGEIAVLETPERGRLEVPRDELPDDAQEGSLLVRHEDEEGEVTFTVDHQAGAKRLEEAKALRGSLTQAPEGNIDL